METLGKGWSKDLGLIMKKTVSYLLIMILVLSTVAWTPIEAGSEVLIIHYNREDEAYDDWNIWAWSEGGAGSATAFEFEDDFGKVAVIPLSAGTTRAGFIVRTDNWDKDVASDRFVDLVDGKAEIWVYSGVEAFVSSAPDGFSPWGPTDSVSEDAAVDTGEEVTDDYKVRVHYHRFDGNYDGWNLWLWPEGGSGAAYSFTESDDFGVVAETLVPGSIDAANIGIIVRLNEWEAKDVDQDRFISTAKVNSQGILEIYLVQSESTIHYSEDSVDLSPKFLSAELSGRERIDISVTVPFVLEGANATFKVVTGDGREVGVKYITSTQAGDMVGTATVVLEEDLDIGSQYFISNEGYEPFPVGMTKAYDLPQFNEAYYYDGDDLGVTYSQEASTFRLWAPTASQAVLKLYEEGLGGQATDVIEMTKDIKGTYVATVSGDLEGVFYTFTTSDDETLEAVDPYALAVGVNGDRAMVVDLQETNPEGWDQDTRPEFVNFTDAIVYELHVRDLSMSETSGIENKGKFLGIIEEGTTGPDGVSTGLDHMKELGITHLQLLPVFDYRTIDETALEDNVFNWGYDPENYNVPEGSYSTDPYDGSLRIKEFKTMVQGLHENDIRVIMDVVYNHTGASGDSHLNSLVPNYYYRTVDGVLSNGSGCGNETASERAMVRKMIVDSVVYWASEYHIDGFRFDLMGLHDMETMTAVRQALDEIDPSIIIYGEGWTGGASPLSEDKRLVKANTFLVEGVGAFSDDLRDGIKGHVFENETPGFVNGHLDMEESIKFGIVGSVAHSQIDYSAVNYSDFPWANTPSESVNYAEAHDNLTLWDKLLITNPNDSEADRIYMDKMSAAIFLTSQGIPFIHAGMEFLRTKDGDHNSYQSPDAVNMLDWQLKADHQDVFEYYKGLIELRKAHPAFRMTDAGEVEEKIRFYGNDESFGQLQTDLDQVVAYVINDHANGDEKGAILVAFNAANQDQVLDLPVGEWTQILDRDSVDLSGLGQVTASLTLAPYESVVLMRDDVIDLSLPIGSGQSTDNEELQEDADDEDNNLDLADDTKEQANEEEDQDKTNPVLPIAGLLILAAGGGGYYFYKKRK